MEMTQPQTFEQLLDVEQAAMLRLAVLMIGSAAEAEEAVQEAFIEVSSRWEALDSPGGYLRTTVVNACREILRRRALAERHRPTAAAASWQSSLVELHDALFRLSDRQRMAVVMRYLLDWTDREIAEALECRQTTVRSLLRRGLSHLRKDLSND